MVCFFVPWRIKSWKSTYNRFNFKDSVVVSQVKRISPLHASMHIRLRKENAINFCRLLVGQAASISSLCTSFSSVWFSSKLFFNSLSFVGRREPIRGRLGAGLMVAFGAYGRSIAIFFSGPAGWWVLYLFFYAAHRWRWSQAKRCDEFWEPIS